MQIDRRRASDDHGLTHLLGMAGVVAQVAAGRPEPNQAVFGQDHVHAVDVGGGNGRLLGAAGFGAGQWGRTSQWGLMAMRTRAVCAWALVCWAWCSACGAQAPLTVRMTPTRYDVAPGQTITLGVYLSNNLTVSPPLYFWAMASFIRDDGSEQVSTATLDLPVSRPVHVRRIRLAIPDPLEYVPNSAAAKGQPLTATAQGQSLEVLLDTSIAEQQTLLVTLDVRRPP
jgi:hypothetical protein